MLIKTKNTNFKIHLPIYMVLSVFLVFFIFLTNSVNVQAANHPYVLPYNVLDYSDNQTLLMDASNISFILSQLPSGNAIDSNNLFIYAKEVTRQNNNHRFFVDVVIVSDPIFTTTITDNFSIWNNQIEYTVNSSYKLYGCQYYINDDGTFTSLWCNRLYSDTGHYLDIFGNYNVQDVNGLTYQYYYPFFASNYFYDSNDNLIIDITSNIIPEDPTYEALEQFLDITSTVSNTFDDSLSDVLNQKGFFDNLIFNLKNFFNSLKNWIYSGFSNLTSNIKNFFGPFLRNIQNYINEFKGNFENFVDAWGHFFEIINSIYNMSLENGEFSLAKLISVLLVPSQEDLSNVFSGTPLYTLYTGIITAVSTFYTTISGVLNSNYVYVFSLPTFTFGGKTFTGLQFSFDWYIPYKSYGDAIISVFLIIAYIRFLMNFIPNFFYGSGFIDHDVNTIHGRTDSL